MKKSFLYALLLLSTIILCASAPALAATLTVTSHESSGTGTLREAIDTLSSPGDTIVFSISNSITVYAELIINKQLTIAGSGQTIGAYGTSAVIFRIDTPTASNTVISGLAIVNGFYGIYIYEASNCTIQDCRIGTDYADNTGRGHTSAGIHIYNGSNNQIGLPGHPNVISGNDAGNSCGICLNNAVASNIQNNFIGLASDGITALPNFYGIDITWSSTANYIGGNRTSGEGNVISGNTRFGINLNGATITGNTICGNIIGLDATQVAAKSNHYGIIFEGAVGNYIGLPQSGYENIIGGNGDGIRLDNAAFGNQIQNNFIGLNAANAAFPNEYGININNGHTNLIGGNLATVPLARNVISGNTDADIYLSSGDLGNTVCGNIIGLDSTGTNAVGSGGMGILIFSDHNLIGGLNNGGSHQLGNIISGHSGGNGMGINLSGGAGNTIAGNTIGLNASGTPVPNRYGINISSSPRNTCIGGNQSGLRNIISGNMYDDVRIYANSGPTYGHTIVGNYIGLDPSGVVTINNTSEYPAISLYEAYDCVIGGTAVGQGNYITGHTDGILLEGTSSGNTITGNFIGVHTDLSASSHPPQNGIIGWWTMTDNFIGLKNSGQGNLIANCVNGIVLQDSSAIRNGIFGNTICAFGAIGISIEANNANNNQARPVITTADAIAIVGTAQANDYIEVFLAEAVPTGEGGSLAYLGAATADGSGNWSLLSPSVSAGEYVCATATDSSNNTSQFCQNTVVQPPPSMTSTPTVTFTATITPTVTATPTITLTPTISPTITVTPTITMTSTITLTATITPTATPSPTATASPSATPTNALGNIALNGKAVLAYPNPAADQMQFLIHLKNAAEIQLDIFNLAGERIAQITRALPAGRGQVLDWDCASVAPGIYLVRVLADGSVLGTQKIAIVKP